MAGSSFAGFGEFEVAVERLLADADWRRALGERGRAYVDGRFRWPEVIDRYARFLERVARAAPRRRGRSGDAAAERAAVRHARRRARRGG